HRHLDAGGGTRSHDDQRAGRTGRLATRGRATRTSPDDGTSDEGPVALRRPLRDRLGDGPTRGRDRLRAAEGSRHGRRSEEHTSELQSLPTISYAVFCLKKKK